MTSHGCRPRSIVLVHGAWAASWCWVHVIPPLEDAGFTVRAVDLPSTALDVRYGANLSGDAEAVRSVMDAMPGEVLVCGHSYGGMVISHSSVGRHPRLAGLVYLCAFMPQSGESLLSFGNGSPSPWIRFDKDGMSLPDPEQAAGLFFGDCPPDTQRWAIERLRRQPPTAFSEPVPTPSWRYISSTYIVCSLDRALPASFQRQVFAPRVSRVLALEASHSPFLSMPAELARVLADCWSPAEPG